MESKIFDRDCEECVWIVVSSYLAIDAHALARLAAKATWAALSSAHRAGDPRLASYDDDLQKKVAVRVKTPHHLARALAEAEAAGISCGMVEAAPGVPGAVGIGPTTREHLPLFLAKLQLLGPLSNAEGESVPVADSPELIAVWLLLRRDLDIPFGKLAPQAGHGLWATVRQGVDNDFDRRVAEWDSSGAHVGVMEVDDRDSLEKACAMSEVAGLRSALIVDAGRTVFSEPTETVAGVGPCTLKELRAAIPFLETDCPPCVRIQ